MSSICIAELVCYRKHEQARPPLRSVSFFPFGSLSMDVTKGTGYDTICQLAIELDLASYMI
jgi:hypothetical protein